MNNGGLAFPQEHTKDCLHCYAGMSLRDFFACHIMQSLVKPNVESTITDAENAYRYATLLIKAREKDYTT